MLRRSSLSCVLLCAVLVSLLTACGGDGSGPGALPSRTGSGLPSRTTTGLPTQDRSTPTARPTNEPTDQPTNQPTAQPTEQPTEQPSAGSTSTPPSASSSPEPTEADQEDQGSDDISPWWWVALVVALLGGGVVAWLLIRRSRRRRAWLADLAAAEEEVGWFARDLVPQLRGSGSVDAVAGGWTVAAPRVTALDDRLTQLVTTAPGDDERLRATAVQDAVRTARDRVAALVSAGGSDTWSLDLDAAQAPLLAVLVPPGSAGEQSPGSAPGQ